MGQIIRFLVILKILVMRVYRHFTELKNIDPWLRYETSKLATTHTSLLKVWKKLNHLRKPILGQVGQFYMLYKWYQRFFMIFIFSIVTQPEMENFSSFLRFFHTFSPSEICYWLRNKNLEKCYKRYA